MADQAQLTAVLIGKIDQFEKQMAQAVKLAAKSADQIEKEFNKANPQVGSIAKGTFIGQAALKGLEKIKQLIVDLPEQFARLSKAADVAGVSMAQAFELAATLGDMDKASKVLTDVGVQLERIRQGAKDTPLQRLFDANNVKIGSDAVTVLRQLGELLGKATAAQKELAIQQGLVSRESVAAAEKAAKSLDDIGGKVRQVSPGFLTLIAMVKDLALQAEIWGLQMLEWILRIGAAGDRMLGNLVQRIKDMAPDIRGLATMGANLPAKPAAPAEDAQAPGGLIATAKAAEDAANKFKQMREEAEKALAARKQFGPDVPSDLGKKGIKIPGAATPGEETDFAREEERIKKRIELIKAETEAIGQSEEQRVAARTKAEFSQKNLTASEIEQLNKLADQYAKLAQQQEEANRRFQAGAQIAATVGNALSNAFADAVLEGKKFNEIMNQLIKTLARAAINAAFTNLFSAQPGGLGNILGLALKGGLAGKQGGGHVRGGRGYVVGERGPELFLPNTSGMIVPNKHLGGGMTVAPVFNIDASGADPAAIARLERALIATNSSIESRVRSTLREDMRRRA